MVIPSVSIPGDCNTSNMDCWSVVAGPRPSWSRMTLRRVSPCAHIEARKTMANTNESLRLTCRLLNRGSECATSIRHDLQCQGSLRCSALKYRGDLLRVSRSE